MSAAREVTWRGLGLRLGLPLLAAAALLWAGGHVGWRLGQLDGRVAELAACVRAGGLRP